MRRILLMLAIFLSLKMEAQQQSLAFLALGDSYTIGESVTEAERWPNQLADSLKHKGIICNKPTIVATTGWRTDNLKNAINIARLKEEYDLVTLLIGVNNQFQGKPSFDYGVEFEDLLKTAIHLAREKKENVIVVSIPDYGFTPYGEKKKEAISKAIDEFNAIAKKITLQYGVTYVNITDISRNGLTDSSLIAGDGLHPSGKMYSLWVQRIIPNVAR